jgi:F-type H+-transporting ATPase subunit gamma
VIHQLLPVMQDEFDIANTKHNTQMLYHPSPEELFHLLVPQYIIGLLYGAQLHSYASEHSSRMNAMKSATNTADGLLSKLRTSYQAARQSAITQEIIEITGTADAQIKGGNYYE